MVEDNILEKKTKPGWYFNTTSLITAFLFVGPLALPLVWFNPHFSRNKKIIITLATLLVTYLLGVLFINSLKTIREYYQIYLHE